MNANTETAQEKKERLRLRKNQLARERRARVKALPERYNILSDEGLTPVDTKPSLLTHFCKEIVITKTAKILFYIKKKVPSCEQCDATSCLAEYWWIENKNEKWTLCDECGIAEGQDRVDTDDESEDETPWCYANDKNAVCNCSQPCSRP